MNRFSEQHKTFSDINFNGNSHSYYDHKTLLRLYQQSDPLHCVVEPTKELGGIWLGNIDAASDYQILRKNGIKAVLTVAARTGLKYNEQIIPYHEILTCDDHPTQDLTKFFDQIYNFIDKYRKITNVFVHCFAGISRSSTSVIMYLMRKNRWSFEKAFFHCRQKRKVTNPNPGFVRQLLNYEKKLMEERIQEDPTPKLGLNQDNEIISPAKKRPINIDDPNFNGKQTFLREQNQKQNAQLYENAQIERYSEYQRQNLEKQARSSSGYNNNYQQTSNLKQQYLQQQQLQQKNNNNIMNGVKNTQHYSQHQNNSNSNVQNPYQTYNQQQQYGQQQRQQQYPLNNYNNNRMTIENVINQKSPLARQSSYSQGGFSNAFNPNSQQSNNYNYNNKPQSHQQLQQQQQQQYGQIQKNNSNKQFNHIMNNNHYNNENQNYPKNNLLLTQNQHQKQNNNHNLQTQQLQSQLYKKYQSLNSNNNLSKNNANSNGQTFLNGAIYSTQANSSYGGANHMLEKSNIYQQQQTQNQHPIATTAVASQRNSAIPVVGGYQGVRSYTPNSQLKGGYRLY